MFSCHEQKSSMNQPGSSGLLATLARGLGLAKFASMPSRSSATSSGVSTCRRNTAPPFRKASMWAEVTLNGAAVADIERLHDGVKKNGNILLYVGDISMPETEW